MCRAENGVYASDEGDDTLNTELQTVGWALGQTIRVSEHIKTSSTSKLRHASMAVNQHQMHAGGFARQDGGDTRGPTHLRKRSRKL